MPAVPTWEESEAIPSWDNSEPISVASTPALPNEIAQIPSWFAPQSAAKADIEDAKAYNESPLINTPAVTIPKLPVTAGDPVAQQVGSAAVNTVSGFVEGMTSLRGLSSILNPGVGFQEMATMPLHLAKEWTEADTPQEYLQAGANTLGAITLPILPFLVGKRGARKPALGDIIPKQPEPPPPAKPVMAPETTAAFAETLAPEPISQPAIAEGVKSDATAALPVGGAAEPLIVNEPIPARPAAAGETPAGGAGMGAADAGIAPKAVAGDVPRPVDTIPLEDLPYAGGNPTGISKAAISEQRAALDLPEIERVKQGDFGKYNDTANAIIAKEPMAPSKLIEELADNDMRPLQPHEAPLLVRRMQETQADLVTAIDDVNRAPDDTVAAKRLEKARLEHDRVTEIVQNTTSRAGASLNSVKLLLNEDFSIARMKSRIQAEVNRGEPLSEIQATKVEGFYKRIANEKDNVAGAAARAEFETALQEAFKEKVAPLSFLERQEQKARERIVARRGRLYADPLGVTQIAHLADEAIIGAAHIGRGLKTFSAWSKAMVAEFGEKISPFLKDLFAESRRLHKETTREESYNKLRQSNIAKRMTELEERKAAGKFTRDKKPHPDKSGETLRAEGKLLGVENEFKAWVAEQKLKAQPWYKKTSNLLQEARGIILGSDIGILFRQGLFAWSRPVTAIKASGRAVKAAFSPEAMDMRSVELRDRIIDGKPVLPQRKAAGLQTTDTLTHPEELVITRLISRLPDIKVGDRTIKLSALGRTLERFQTTFINDVRVEMFDQAIKRGLSPDELKLRANFINSSTGRGNAKHVPRLLSTIMTSPRYEMSRWEMIGQPVRNLGALARDGVKGNLNRAALDNLRDMAVTGAEIYALFKLVELSGYSVNWNPSSSDFLKMRKGEEVWDVSAGLAPRIRDLLRLYIAFDHPSYQANLGKTITGMVLRTINPAIKTGIEQTSVTKQKLEGVSKPKLPFEGFTADDERMGLITMAPLIFQSMNQALAEGAGAAAFTGAREFVGTSVSRYPEPKEKKKSTPFYP